MEDDQVLSLNRPESQLTNLPGHSWRDKWTALSGPLSERDMYGDSVTENTAGVLSCLNAFHCLQPENAYGTEKAI